jgi:hypothetical protein
MAGITIKHSTGSCWNTATGTYQEVLNYMFVSGLMPCDLKGFAEPELGSITILYFKTDL